VKKIVQKEFDMVGLHILTDGTDDIENLIAQIIENILNEIKSEAWSESMLDKLKEHIKTAGAFEDTIELRPDSEEFIKIG
jgi:D-mannonate dehydratase